MSEIVAVEDLYEVTVGDADFSAMIEITPEGVVITRLPDEDAAADLSSVR